jgi:hypothetical protein
MQAYGYRPIVECVESRLLLDRALLYDSV